MSQPDLVKAAFDRAQKIAYERTDEYKVQRVLEKFPGLMELLSTITSQQPEITFAEPKFAGANTVTIHSPVGELILKDNSDSKNESSYVRFGGTEFCVPSFQPGSSIHWKKTLIEAIAVQAITRGTTNSSGGPTLPVSQPS